MWHTLEAMHSLERSWPGKESLFSSMPCMDKVCLSTSHVRKSSLTSTYEQKASHQAAGTRACMRAHLSQVAYALLGSVCNQVTTPNDLSQAVLGALGNLQVD